VTLILASTSSTRIALLENAGIAFEARSPGVDERALEEPLLTAGATPAEIALALARAKAMALDAPGQFVLGADQVLDLDGERFVKPADGEPHHAAAFGRGDRAISGRSWRIGALVGWRLSSGGRRNPVVLGNRRRLFQHSRTSPAAAARRIAPA
jgi:septum formation protein